jgi:glycosyltransferase involved in cell wall biosynthesis
MNAKIPKTDVRMKRIAIIGSRGIPGNYGGFETFAERLGIGLVDLGHDVAVYCPSSSSSTDERWYQGIRRVIVPTIQMKALEKISSSFFSCVHAAFTRYDIILFLGVAPALFAWLPRLTGKKLIMNIDGLEWKRRKWGRFASGYLKLSERFANTVCHEFVADSQAIQDYIKAEYGRDAAFISYGAVPGRYEDESVLTQYGLKKGGYFIQVCRLEPENNSDVVIREYNTVSTDMPLVIVGDAPYADAYKKMLHDMAGGRVRFLGGVYGHEYDVLRSNAFCYIHAHEVGGTNPSLLEALAAGNCVIVLDVPYNLEVIGEAGLSFSKEPGSLKAALENVLTHPEMIPDLRQKAVNRIQKHYTWDSVINEYEKLFRNINPYERCLSN